MTAIFLRPQTAVDAARNAMYLWVNTVAPAIFPFAALMPMLTDEYACALYRKTFSFIMNRVFRLPGEAAPAVVIGMIAGSPAGAQALANIAVQTGMKKSELKRIAPVICGVSPAYLLAGVGVGLYGSREIGMKLVAMQLIAQILMLLFSRFFIKEDGETVTQQPKPSLSGIRSAVITVLTVCGYMTVFSVSAAVLAEWIGKPAGKLLLIAADLPSGVAALVKSGLPGSHILLGAAVGFAGLCISAQNMDLLAPLGVSWREFLVLKFAQSGLCAAVSAAVFASGGPENVSIAAPKFPIYAFSLLIALLFSLPVLISLSKKLFLNKAKPAGIFSDQ